MEPWQLNWHKFVAEGYFEDLPGLDEVPLNPTRFHNNLVTSRDGILNYNVGIVGDRCLLRRGKNSSGELFIVSTDDVRCAGDVHSALLKNGFVEVPSGRYMEMTPDTNKIPGIIAGI